ncbi:thiosulfate sulfurtransferase GlpE [Shewanella nanhaiensis]|uniref:Thiosulfate sulfurtransferase GlpE n=1 Tax=Shewanella nanhaiensis TaxID=2864872 RepID=A0ABS7E8X6_9GAMM|nr:thiosulfate sulfurtransferase GlpE [Shewanella nanhaiensis]MBW8186137.1 thiosulfate sulfurtransferase GlpE [Shewanella nanhaiensis]
MSTFQHLSVSQLIRLSEANPEIQIVDIRDAASFESAHIKNSVNLNNDNLANYIAEADMDQPLIVVCYHGISSQGAAQYLVEQGFDDVYSLDGGYQAWRESEE